MRKLKLQVQLTVDGFAAGPNGELDWMTWDWDDEIKRYVNELTDSVDTILMGRKMTDGFISYWAKAVSDPGNSEYPFAKKMVDYPKVVFSKTLDESKWENTVIAKGELTEEVDKLKNQSGKDMIVYGGAGFVSNLIDAGLIDEYYLFVNPAAIGNGMRIFRNDEKKNLKLVKCRPFPCGIVVNRYVPR